MAVVNIGGKLRLFTEPISDCHGDIAALGELKTHCPEFHLVAAVPAAAMKNDGSGEGAVAGRYEHVRQHPAIAVFCVGHVIVRGDAIGNRHAWFDLGILLRPGRRRLRRDAGDAHALMVKAPEAGDVKITQVGPSESEIHRALGAGDLFNEFAIRIPDPDVRWPGAIDIAGAIDGHAVSGPGLCRLTFHGGKEAAVGEVAPGCDIEGDNPLGCCFGCVENGFIGAENDAVGGLDSLRGNGGFTVGGDVGDLTGTRQREVNAT